MKRRSLFALVLIPGLVFCQATGPFAPGTAVPSSAEDSVKEAVLDYAEGFYSGDASKMKNAIHYDLNKAFPRYLPNSGQVALTYSTYSMLVGLCAAKTGVRDDTARHIRVRILEITPETATVKLLSADFNDYLQLAKTAEGWKIINVLWNSPGNAAWLKDFSPEEEHQGIGNAVNAYLQGTQSGDVGRLRVFVSDDFNRASFVPAGKGGAMALQRIRFDGLSQNSWAGNGRQEETQRDNSYEILDVMDGLAAVKLSTVRSTEYLQLYKDSNGWKVFNSYQVQRKDPGLSRLLPAIIGEPMPAFSLPVHGGGTYTLAGHKGKNILLLFPRGRVGSSWCAFCPYQYLDLAELEKKEQILRKYNLEIVFVMPYDDGKVADWLAKFPETMKTLEGIKNPPEGTTGIRKEFADWTRVHFPHSFDLSGGVPDAFPVLVDEDRSLSKQLKIFTSFWDGVNSEQNIASVFLVDGNGILRWKYVSQMTEDRPSTDFLMQMVRETMQ
jgi:thiol-disulfide isomerase/thioredoxin